MMWLREPWRTRMLFASVACNLFLLGVIGVHAARRERGAPDMASVVERMARGLSAEDAARLRAATAPGAAWRDDARQRMDEARAALARSIMDTPYDERQVRARMVALQQAWMESSGRFGETLTVAIGTLSPEGRARLAALAERGPKR